MMNLKSDPWPFLPLQLRMTCSVVNDGKEIHLNLPDDFVGQHISIGRVETSGFWYLHLSANGFKLEAGPNKTAFVRIPVGAFPELKFKSFAQAYYDGERRASRILCGKMFDHLAHRQHEIKREEMAESERQRRMDAVMQANNLQPRKQLTLKNFDELPQAIQQRKEEQKPMIALYPINIATGKESRGLFFTLPHQFAGKSFKLCGEPGNRWLEEASDGVMVQDNSTTKENAYLHITAYKRGLVLIPSMRKRFTVQWTGTKLMLGAAVEEFIRPAELPAQMTTRVPVTKEPALTAVPMPVLRRDLDEDELEIVALKDALATVNRIAKKRDMQVIIKDDGSVGLKMVVVSEF